MPLHYNNTKSCHGFRILVGALCLLTSTVHTAQCAPVPSTPAQTRNVLAASEVKNEEALKIKVSFSAKSELLSDLLLDLQKQSRVTLRANDGIPERSVRVTAYIQNLALWQVLLGLSRVYGVRWAKHDEKTFVMLSSDQGELEKGLLQLGDIDETRKRFITELRTRPEDTDWPPQITKYISEESLMKGASPLISTLPPELLRKIRREKEDQAALQLVDAQQRAMEASINDYVIRVEAPSTQLINGVPSTTPARVLIRTGNRQFITILSRPQTSSANRKVSHNK